MVRARSVSDLVHERPMRAPSSWKHGQNTDKTIKGFGTLIPKPLICWLRGLDLNQRPLGYEPTPGPHCNRLLPIKAAETRASPSPPLGGANKNTYVLVTRIRSAVAWPRDGGRYGLYPGRSR